MRNTEFVNFGFTHYVLLFTFHYLRFTIYVSLIVYHSLHITHYSLLFTHYILRYHLHQSCVCVIEFLRILQ
jgi:hypothetical protein